MRLPSEATALFRLLALNATAHGDMLFSEPGMLSLNFWSGVRTPTLANVTHWFSLLSPPRQQAIIRSLEAHPRAIIILAREHIDYLTRHSFAPAGELHDYIERNFTSAFVLDNFEFRVRNGRRIEPLMLGEMLVLSEKQEVGNTALKLRLLLPPGATVSRIDLSSPREPQNPPLVFDATNSRIEIVGPAPQVAPWPLRVEGIATVLIHFDRFKQSRPVAGGLITLRAADGSEVALARLKQ